MLINTYRVLVCEDDPAMVRIFQFLLQKQGIGPVLTVSDGTKVVAMIERDRLDLAGASRLVRAGDGQLELR